jgi:protein-S-isoprenylcysteine O-methyltransferase Ste14
MLLLFFIAWGVDLLGLLFLGHSTIFIGLKFFPLLIFPALVSLILSLYLVAKSHEAVFSDTKKNKLIESGVYAWVRHPMYLGILLFCLGFFFISPSAIAFLIWIAFFIFYEKMTEYEEKDLIKILGKDYIYYKKRVPKWFPGLKKSPKK